MAVTIINGNILKKELGYGSFLLCQYDRYIYSKCVKMFRYI